MLAAAAMETEAEGALEAEVSKAVEVEQAASEIEDEMMGLLQMRADGDAAELVALRGLALSRDGLWSTSWTCRRRPAFDDDRAQLDQCEPRLERIGEASGATPRAPLARVQADAACTLRRGGGACVPCRAVRLRAGMHTRVPLCVRL